MAVSCYLYHSSSVRAQHTAIVACHGHTSPWAGAEGRRGRPAATATAAAVAAGAPRTMHWGCGRDQNRTVHRCCWSVYTCQCMQHACVPFLRERNVEHRGEGLTTRRLFFHQSSVKYTRYIEERRQYRYIERRDCGSIDIYGGAMYI